jgi:ComF family protein
VHALKYAGLPRIAVDLADAMVRRLVPPPEHAVLVPIPLAPRRLRQRGYNQSAMLAQALGRGWGRPVRDDLLARARETATQTALTPAARLANVAGAFETGNAEVGTRNELVLVDDVFTTGATLAEAARALETAGAEAGSVTAVTFGRALIPDFT